MAITGINTLDGKQIIAAGASSAISAQQALQTSGGNSLQGLYDFVSTNSGSWTGGGGSEYSAGSGIDITDDVISVDNTIARTADVPNIFVAIYNSTPFSALQEAYAAGKTILCKDSVSSPFVYMPDTYSIYQGDLSYIKFAGILNLSTNTLIDNYTQINQYVCFSNGWQKYAKTAYDALQSDWNETGTKNIAYIKNKPDIPTVQLNGDNQVSAINNYPLAGGSFPASADEACQVVTANSANWGDIPTKVVATSADATGSNILYVVTGS
jgi:hypothetical protein